MIIAFLPEVSNAFVAAVRITEALPVPLDALNVSQEESQVAVHEPEAVIAKVSLLLVNASIERLVLFTDKVGVTGGGGGGGGAWVSDVFLLQPFRINNNVKRHKLLNVTPCFMVLIFLVSI